MRPPPAEREHIMPGDAFPKAMQVLEFIKGYIKDNEFPPSIREICYGVGISSTSVANYYLSRLVGWGLITRLPGVARSIRVMRTKEELA